MVYGVNSSGGHQVHGPHPPRLLLHFRSHFHLSFLFRLFILLPQFRCLFRHQIKSVPLMGVVRTVSLRIAHLNGAANIVSPSTQVYALQRSTKSLALEAQPRL